MEKLTGNKDADFLILMQLNDYEIGKVCQVNKYVKSLCDDDNFWRNRFMKKYNKFLSINDANRFKSFLGFSIWKEMNKYFSEIKEKRIPIFIKLLKEEDFIDEAINLIIKDELPIWVDRKLLIKETRKDIIPILFRRDILSMYEIKPMLKKMSILKDDVGVIINLLQDIHKTKIKKIWENL